MPSGAWTSTTAGAGAARSSPSRAPTAPASRAPRPRTGCPAGTCCAPGARCGRAAWGAGGQGVRGCRRCAPHGHMAIAMGAPTVRPGAGRGACRWCATFQMGKSGVPSTRGSQSMRHSCFGRIWCAPAPCPGTALAARLPCATRPGSPRAAAPVAVSAQRAAACLCKGLHVQLLSRGHVPPQVRRDPAHCRNARGAPQPAHRAPHPAPRADRQGERALPGGPGRGGGWDRAG